MSKEPNVCYVCEQLIDEDNCCYFYNNQIKSSLIFCANCTDKNVDESLKAMWYSANEAEMLVRRIDLCPYCDRDIGTFAAYSCILFKGSVHVQIPFHVDCFDANIGLAL
jgi:hypothetical protein